MAAVVDVERVGSDVEVLQVLLFLDAIEDFPVAVAPAVDALLDVAHEQSLAARSEFLEEQLLEVLPLHAARVLKLVDHHVVDEGAYLLEDEGCIAALYHLAEKGRRGTERETTGIAFNLSGTFIDVVEQAERSEVSQSQRCGKVFFAAFLVEAGELGKTSLQVESA